MRRRIENSILVLVVLALALIACSPRFANSMSVIQPGGAALQGNPICTSTPTLNSLLVWNSTQWCGSLSPVLTNMRIDAPSEGTSALSVYVAASGQAAIATSVSGDTYDRFVYEPGTGLAIGNGAAAPTLVIDESGNWKGNAVTSASGIISFVCHPSANVSVPANTTTEICAITTGTLPAAPHTTWIVSANGQADITLSSTAGNCALSVSDGANTNAVQAGPIAASAETTLTGMVQDQVTTNASLSPTINLNCTVAATVNRLSSILSIYSSALNVTVTPQ